CIIFIRAKLRHSEALMGLLPANRVNVSRPFSHCGVDYAGPFLLREGKRRNAQSHKSYFSLFVFFATKAVQLELVSDLTSKAFIAALKRFISRRGKCLHMYSDNQQRVEQTQQHFWSSECFYSHQARTKWMIDKGTELSTNQLVLIK
ncbi:hypothetical protein ALC62_12642, partial [Cyphomyrmex costatus]